MKTVSKFLVGLLVLGGMFTATSAHAQSYVCYNRDNINKEGTEEKATLVALFTFDGSYAHLKVVKNTKDVPNNWKLVGGRTYQLANRSDFNDNYFFTADSYTSIFFKRYNYGDSELHVGWDVTAIPATKDEPAYGTNGALKCWKQ